MEFLSQVCYPMFMWLSFIFFSPDPQSNDTMKKTAVWFHMPSISYECSPCSWEPAGSQIFCLNTPVHNWKTTVLSAANQIQVHVITWCQQCFPVQSCIKCWIIKQWNIKGWAWMYEPTLPLNKVNTSYYQLKWHLSYNMWGTLIFTVRLERISTPIIH